MNALTGAICLKILQLNRPKLGGKTLDFYIFLQIILVFLMDLWSSYKTHTQCSLIYPFLRNTDGVDTGQLIMSTRRFLSNGSCSRCDWKMASAAVSSYWDWRIFFLIVFGMWNVRHELSSIIPRAYLAAFGKKREGQHIRPVWKRKWWQTDWSESLRSGQVEIKSRLVSTQTTFLRKGWIVDHFVWVSWELQRPIRN
jgi:hypothetical protein